MAVLSDLATELRERLDATRGASSVSIPLLPCDSADDRREIVGDFRNAAAELRGTGVDVSVDLVERTGGHAVVVTRNGDIDG